MRTKGKQKESPVTCFSPDVCCEWQELSKHMPGERHTPIHHHYHYHYYCTTTCSLYDTSLHYITTRLHHHLLAFPRTITPPHQ
ncbi:hypothetical protein E2C01_046703 [Portunus trituberculatus]|uniref:Uncharacterized protein n=1 Tax=Portunus trituberculatus TaxID=210409 RepID=A0A5B7G5T3_PORTR|nr:hypothetical protein [Portunus trituberculatus]